MRQLNLWLLHWLVSCLSLLTPPGLAADLGAVVVRFAGYEGPAKLVAQSIDAYKLRIDVDPKTETNALLIRVELPHTGRKAWPVADVEVRDAYGQAVAVRRGGIEWHTLLIPARAEHCSYFVQAVDPPEGETLRPSDRERQFADSRTGMSVSVARWYDGRQAALSLRFDDSHPTHLSKAIPLLSKYGFRGTFMVNPGPDEPGSGRHSAFQSHRAEWEAVARSGDHEFANHSAHHRGATGDADMEAEIGNAAQAIWTLTPGRSRLMALNLGGGTQWETSRTLRYYLDKYHLFVSGGSLGMDDTYGQRVAAFQAHVERHLQRGLWCRAHFHAIGKGLSSSEANFVAALDIAREYQSSLWIAGMADIYKYQSERCASSLSLLESDVRGLRFRLHCQTELELYDQVLTIELTPPASWRPDSIAVKDAQGEAIAVRLAHASGRRVLRFDLAPRTTNYAIELSP
jgi:hypothetical protein